MTLDTHRQRLCDAIVHDVWDLLPTDHRTPDRLHARDCFDRDIPYVAPEVLARRVNHFLFDWLPREPGTDWDKSVRNLLRPLLNNYIDALNRTLEGQLEPAADAPTSP